MLNPQLPKPADGYNKLFAETCHKILSDYKEKKITKAQFLEACDYLDEAAKAYEVAREAMWKRIHGD